MAIVVYSDFTDRELDLFEVGRQQIDAVILAGLEDSAPAIRATVSRARSPRLPRGLCRPLWRGAWRLWA